MSLKPKHVGKVEVALPGTTNKLGIQQLGINMPVKFEKRMSPIASTPVSVSIKNLVSLHNTSGYS